eukprot:6208737-Pleurochrysis_carterae.AAC.1
MSGLSPVVGRAQTRATETNNHECLTANADGRVRAIIRDEHCSSSKNHQNVRRIAKKSSLSTYIQNRQRAARTSSSSPSPVSATRLLCSVACPERSCAAGETARALGDGTAQWRRMQPRSQLSACSVQLGSGPWLRFLCWRVAEASRNCAWDCVWRCREGPGTVVRARRRCALKWGNKVDQTGRASADQCARKRRVGIERARLKVTKEGTARTPCSSNSSAAIGGSRTRL